MVVGIKVEPTFMEKIIKAKKFEDENLNKVKNKMVSGETNMSLFIQELCFL